MKRFKGFTMTELMVALAVIGIIVAVVTPAIMKTRPNKNKMMIKKTFYTTEQIVSTLINDARLYPDMRELCYVEDNSFTEDSDNYCAWGFDYKNDVTFEGETYGGDTKFRDLFVSRLNINNAKTDEANSIYYTTDGVRWSFIGTLDAWEPAGSDINQHKGTILVDVNGEDEPNCTQAICNSDDFDMYRINIYANGKLEIDPGDTKAIEYATINTSIRDAL